MAFMMRASRSIGLKSLPVDHPENDSDNNRFLISKFNLFAGLLPDNRSYPQQNIIPIRRDSRAPSIVLRASPGQALPVEIQGSSHQCLEE